MEILVGVVVLVIVVAVGISALSPKDTKLFRRIWSSEKTGAFDAQQDAVNELLVRFNLSIPKDAESDNLEKLGDSIGRLMAKAVEFDVNHKINLGVVVSAVLSRNLESRLHAVGIKEFDEQFKMIQEADVFKLGETMNRIENSINIVGKIQNTIDLFTNNIVKGKEQISLDTHGAYYIGYIYGIVQEMCRQDGVECGDVYLTPVYQEVRRLFGSEADSLFECSPKKLTEVVATERGKKGLRDGHSDGSYVVNPTNPPPYFGRLQAYFT